MTKNREDTPAVSEGDNPAESPVDEAGETQGEEAEADYKALAAELNDRMLRTAAELENFRRRAEKERQDTAKFAIAAFARDCLTVLDNLRRGLDSVSQEERKENPALETLAAGMELTERELLSTLERHGIVKVDPLGEEFDYDRHQAMFEVEDTTKPSGTVVEVVQPGYLLNDRLLRPAMVGVSKGGPKPETVQAPIANEDLATAPDKATDGKQAPDGSDEAAGGAESREGSGPVDTKA